MQQSAIVTIVLQDEDEDKGKIVLELRFLFGDGLDFNKRSFGQSVRRKAGSSRYTPTIEESLVLLVNYSEILHAVEENDCLHNIIRLATGLGQDSSEIVKRLSRLLLDGGAGKNGIRAGGETDAARHVHGAVRSGDGLRVCPDGGRGLVGGDDANGRWFRVGQSRGGGNRDRSTRVGDKFGDTHK